METDSRNDEHGSLEETSSPEAPQETGKRPRFPVLRKVLKWGGIVVGSLIALLFLVCAVWDYRATRRLEKTLARIEESGGPLTLADLEKEYEESLRGKNGAKYYRAASELMEENDRPYELREELPIAYRERAALGKRLSPEVMKKAEVYLESNKEFLNLVEKGASCESCVFDLNFTDGAGMPLPHLGKMRDAGRLLKLRGLIEATNGNTERAIETATISFKLAGSLKKEPILISALVRKAILETAVAQVEYQLSIVQLPNDQLQKLDSAISSEINMQQHHRVFLAERGLGIWVFSKMLDENDFGFLVTSADSVSPIGRKIRGALLIFLGGPIKNQFSRYIDNMTELIELTKLPPRQARKQVVEHGKEFEKRFKDSGVFHRINNFMLGLLLPALTRSYDALLISHERLGMARVALAVEAYRNDNGSLPLSLDELTPKYIDEIPEDYFSDGKVKFVKLSKGYLIYSVGMDEKDNAGTFNPERFDDWSEGYDIVFRVVR